jgi:serine/threonine-protein kinase
VASPASILGRTLGHYRVVEQIGAGGMGVIYRAHDERLERDVALKVLPPGTLADAASRKRFRKEALALSSLNHPNIATVHDFDVQDDIDFLVTELVPGKTLDEKLGTGPLAEKEVVQIGEQMFEGLEAAHHAGVIHRDLKPGNLRLTPEGRLKILDFGLAKRMEPMDADSVTRTAAEVGPAGTLPYMAPEQLRGEEVDGRADIWSAGVVLYEMATKRRPFEGNTATTLADAILHSSPPAAQDVLPTVSRGLAEIILKCLEKEPENRYQSAKEVAVDLRRLARPTSIATAPALVHGRRNWRRSWIPAVVTVALLAVVASWNFGALRKRLLGIARAPHIESIAVLPLANLSRDPEQEYLADGMTEALITDLSQIRALKVISRTSVMQYKKTNKRLPQIARELGVDAVMEGSVLREGEQVRVSIQLIDGATDEHLWAREYENEYRSILVLQKEVARTVAQQIKIRLTPQEQVGLAVARAVDPQAHESYLKGRYYFNQRTEDALNRSIAYFQQAIARDPNYALAYCGLADAYALLGFRGRFPSKDALSRAKAAALKAIELDDTLAEPHASLAFIAETHEWDWATAEREYKRALELNPGDARAHHWYAGYLMYVGRFEEGIAEAKRARDLDPLSLPVNNALAGRLLVAGRVDEALEQLQKTLEMNPHFAPAHQTLGWAYLNKGKHEEAIQEFQKAVELSGTDDSDLMVDLGFAYAAAGKREEARKILARLMKQHERGLVPPGSIAILYGALGELDEAFAWLEKAYEERDPELTYIKVPTRRFEPLRHDPRFRKMLLRMGLAD